MKAIWLLLGAVGFVGSVPPLFALIGLGVHRQAAPPVVALAAVLWVYLPALLGASLTKERPWSGPLILLVWSAVVYAALIPVYFPAQRGPATLTGLAVLTGSEPPEWISESLPEEPVMSAPEVAVAEVVQELPPPPPLDTHEISLPYEGDGRILRVPVVFEEGGTEVEVEMLLDTGATYTTLSMRMLDQLGITIPADAPELTMSTANGDRQARIVLIDRVWLGDQPIEKVAISVCESCDTKDGVGLLGNNVTGGFNLTIDQDRREVLFSKRAGVDRRLDIKPFLDVNAQFRRFPGGRVEIDASANNTSPWVVSEAIAKVGCGEHSWQVSLGPIEPGELAGERRRLPPHDDCGKYRVSLGSARW